jgi:hypothetical protein
VGNANGSATLTGGFTYVVPGTVLLSDDFNDGDATGWTVSPLGNAAGWTVVNGALTYNGTGHTQIYRGDPAWTDYTFDVSFRLSSLNNFPGGIRGRVDPATGTSYTIWLYPASSQMVLFRTTGWNIDSLGLTQLGSANSIAFDSTNFHRLRLTFQGTSIQVFYDDVLVISAADATHTSGVIALDVSNQPITFDNVNVIFGTVPPSPILAVTPNSLTFTAQEGEPNPSSQILSISNAGDGLLNWTASETADWLSLSPTNGTAPSLVVVSANISGLTAGSYGTNITVTDPNATNSPLNIPVTLTISSPALPTISGISPASGSTAGGTAVLVSGSGFTGGSTLTIRGVSATNVVVNSATSISAVTPAGVAGPADVTVSTSGGTATLGGGFTYITPGTVLLGDDFADGVADGWTISPLGHAAGWSVVNGVYSYNGEGHTQAYRGDAGWSDYTLEVAVRLSSLSNYPGGIRGRVNPATGAGYAVWLYPGSGEIRLFRATGWNIDGPGLTQLGQVREISFVPGTFHRVRMVFEGARIDVYWDGVLVISAVDTAYSSGVIALDVSNQRIDFDDVVVAFGVITPQPLISGISPASGSTAGGTAVKISGSGFPAGSTVTIGGVNATNVVVNSATSISAVTPSGVAGPVDVVVSTSVGSATLPGGFTYVVPGGTLLTDDFSDGVADGWTISPLGHAAGWSVVNGVYSYNGEGHTQAYRGDAGWSDYTLEVAVRLSSLSNYPGGIRGRVNLATGAGYAVWLYPGSGEIRLFRATGWSIDSPGLTQLGVVGGINFDTVNFHLVRLTFRGALIEVYYNGVLVMSTTDTAYSSGVIALDVSNRPIEFDNVIVSLSP